MFKSSPLPHLGTAYLNRMSNGGCKLAITDVIEIDEEEEDVEVVFSNINKTHVGRNLLYRKVTQEIELLQAMCKYKIPKGFFEFKELAVKLGFTLGNDVIHSAWQRLIKRHLGQPNNTHGHNSATSTSNIKSFNCSAETIHPQPSLQLPVEVSSPRVSHLQPSPHASTILVHSPSPSLTAATIFPVAIVSNHIIKVSNSHSSRTECFNKSTKCNGTLELDPFCNKSEQSGHEMVNTEFVDEFESGGSSTQRQIEPNNNQKVSNGKKKCIRKGREGKEINCANSAELSKSWSEESMSEVQSSTGISFDSYFDKVLQSSVSGIRKNKNKRTTQNRKSVSESPLNKKVTSPDLSKTREQSIMKSHVGVQARVVKKKNTPPSSKKRLSKIIKEMSEAELKEFKAEQKRLKLQHAREFEIQELQKVHDRLVDVLIPKYYNKDLSDKG